jgi:hypothetical protein
LKDDFKQLTAKPASKDYSLAIDSLTKATESLKSKLAQVEQKISRKITD